MPELPEVETYRRYLEQTALHQLVTDIYVEDTKLLTTDYDTLAEKLKGRQFTGTRRTGKNLFVLLDAPYALRMHFGMSGSLAYFHHTEATPRFARIVFSLAGGFRLGFLCPRKFERIGLVDDVEAFLADKKIGKDGLEISIPELGQTLRRRKASVKPVLLDQATVAGLGNWIVDEVLFQARIHPEKPASELTDAEVIAIHASIQLVLETAIRYEAVYCRFPGSFLIHARAWDASPHADADRHHYCPRCGGGLNLSKVGGRTTYACGNCQRK